MGVREHYSNDFRGNTLHIRRMEDNQTHSGREGTRGQSYHRHRGRRRQWGGNGREGERVREGREGEIRHNTDMTQLTIVGHLGQCLLTLAMETTERAEYSHWYGRRERETKKSLEQEV